MSIVLNVIEGPMKGKEYVFDEPEIFLFGRDKDCHFSLANDHFISRHHFMLEINPPEVKLKDLGSLNGTFINNTCFGGRDDHNPVNIHEAKKSGNAVRLRDGDIIRVGRTKISLKIDQPWERLDGSKCVKCGADIKATEKEYYMYISGTYLCNNCREKHVEKNTSGNKRRNEVYTGNDEKPGDVLLDEMLSVLFGKTAEGQIVMPQIQGYRFMQELGSGGFGKVYLVERVRDNKKLAMKLMISKKKEVNEKDIALFQQEMNNCKMLKHENIVAFEEHSFFNGIFYFTMEFCGGGCMGELLEKHGGYLEVDDALPHMFQVLEGLDFIHKNNFVHRDLKPDNILLDESLKISKIADLGLAKSFQKSGFSGFNIPINFAGTPHYMPKEQVTNFKDLMPTSDVFSIGATFYKMLTGKYVYDFTNSKDPIATILNSDTIPIHKRKWMIPKSIADVIDRSVSVNFKDRYRDAGEMKRALENAI